ncbi:HEAT repeat domain-containing protein [Streptomyces sp. NPDC059650]|uniref:HEAT repeat domain-containing protein n=1 Tax=Streptomyces sp. NPDC059650 TaxID=3346896 RepID=UPI00369C316C
MPPAAAGPEAAGAGGTVQAGGPGVASARLLALLALAEEGPSLAVLEPYLADPDPAVRTAAVAVLTDTAPAGAGPVLAARLADPASAVRAAAAASLRELVEVLEPAPELGAALRAVLGVADPLVRAAALAARRPRRGRPQGRRPVPAAPRRHDPGGPRSTGDGHHRPGRRCARVRLAHVTAAVAGCTDRGQGQGRCRRPGTATAEPGRRVAAPPRAGSPTRRLVRQAVRWKEQEARASASRCGGVRLATGRDHTPATTRGYRRGSGRRGRPSPLAKGELSHA